MNLQKLLTLTMTALVLAACSPLAAFKGGSADNSSTGGDDAGLGSKIPGIGALSVPTGDALVARLQNGIGVNAGVTTSNFSKALTALKTNLPKVTDPTKATGFDSAQLLVYAACTDLTTGGTASKMNTMYQVVATQTIAQNQAKLVAAGVSMLDKYTAGLASASTATPAVNAAFNKLISDVSGGANTSTIAFVSVCIAANTTGAAMLGF